MARQTADDATAETKSQPRTAKSLDEAIEHPFEASVVLLSAIYIPWVFSQGLAFGAFYGSLWALTAAFTWKTRGSF